MKARQMRDCISALRNGDSIIKDIGRIKALGFYHYNCKFKDHDLKRPRLEGVCFKKLYVEDKVNLEAPFSLLDIKDAIWYSTKDKSLDPNEFTMGLYKVA